MRRFNLSDPNFTYDSDDPEGFRAGLFRMGPDAGRRATPARASTSCRPGEALCPYHYEYGEEEWLLVVEGRPHLRTPDGTEQLDDARRRLLPDAARRAPTRSGTRPTSRAHVLMWSTSCGRPRTAYPDSDKVGLWLAPGDSLMVRRSSGVEYYDGETYPH